jgi:TolB-like protein
VRTLRIFLAIFAVAVLPAAARAQSSGSGDKVTIAVFPITGFMPGAADKEMAVAFRSMIMTELGSNAKFVIVERNMLDEMLTAQKISLSGSLSNDQVKRIGELLGAQYGVAGSVSLDAKDARLDLRMIDIETGVSVSAPFKDQVPRDRMLSLVNRVATDFAANARVKTRAETIVVVPAPAALAYSRGLDYEKRGRKQEAAKMYSKALELFPRHPDARTALQRVN